MRFGFVFSSNLILNVFGLSLYLFLDKQNHHHHHIPMQTHDHRRQASTNIAGRLMSREGLNRTLPPPLPHLGCNWAELELLQLQMLPTLPHWWDLVSRIPRWQQVAAVMELVHQATARHE